MKQYKYIVGVRCLTYNHASYITDTLKGFIEQQTTFPYVCVVVDDASTDGEQDVIKSFVNEHFDINNVNAENRETEYAYITCAPHKSNKNCSIVVLYLKYNHYQIKKNKLPYLSEWLDNSKYHALCEGDDYWIDPLKLQKQVDFMEKHPNHSLCFHAHTVVCGSNVENRFLYDNDVEKCRVKDLILADADAMATGAMLFKNVIGEDCLQWATGLSFGDFPLELTLAEKGCVGYINDNMSVYRLRTPGSWSHSTSTSLEAQISHRKERLRMWRSYNKWTHSKYVEIVLRMYMCDIFRLCMFKYMKIFNMKESKLYIIFRWMYRKLK